MVAARLRGTKQGRTGTGSAAIVPLFSYCPVRSDAVSCVVWLACDAGAAQWRFRSIHHQQAEEGGGGPTKLAGAAGRWSGSVPQRSPVTA